MIRVYMVIGDAGDGSNFIEWHRTMSDEKVEKMELEDQYQSGDGVQIHDFWFTNEEQLNDFIEWNFITFYEDHDE